MDNAQKKVMPLWQCILIAAIGVFLMLAGIFAISMYYRQAAELEKNANAQWFDPYSSTEELQGLELLFITEPFAEYTYGTSQGFYIVYDEDMYAYIICMEQDRLKKEFLANYEYAYGLVEEEPELGYVEGYAVEIDEDLKQYAIEYWNALIGEEVVDGTNFEEYFGAYYLDTTIKPEVEGGSTGTAVAMIIVGLLLLVVAFVKLINRSKLLKEQEQREQEEREKMIRAAAYGADSSYMSDIEGFEEATNTESTYSDEAVVEKQGNIVVALVASVICACAGAVLWVLIYRLGYIAGITGCVAAAGALFGYEKIGKRPVTGGVIAWSIFVSLVVLLLGNAVAYAWEFTDVLSAGSPGRAEFFVVFKQLFTLLDEYDCIPAFFGDWGMGVFFATLSGFSIGNKKK